MYPLSFSDKNSYDVDNLSRGSSGKHLAFAGHTDVVPPGNENYGSTSFFCKNRGDKLYGRGQKI